MSQNFYGSVCLTDLIEKAKSKHSSFTKAQNGKIYCNVTVWLNDDEDKFGNVISIQANSSKEMASKEEKFYLGNCKKSKVKPISDNDFEGVDDIDIPERIETTPMQEKDAKDDLPF
jgi:hypothetical protein